MENNSSQAAIISSSLVISPEQLLEHWQGHRRVTRRLIETFPEKELFNYSIGGMRPFSELVMEMIGMAAPGIEGVITANWQTINSFDQPAPQTKAELLGLWDEVTEQLNNRWPQIPPHRFQEVDVAFGQYEGQIYWTILYFIDNEIHHRGQAYVYLRSLGIAPPAFWDRS
jgi:uncharacterized damage-inducible protein DinB